MAGRRLRPPSIQKDLPCAPLDASSWAPVPDIFRTADTSLPGPWSDLFGPLRRGRIDVSGGHHDAPSPAFAVSNPRSRVARRAEFAFSYGIPVATFTCT